MLTEKFYKVRRDDNSVGIRCYTRFVNDINDDVHYFIDTETGRCCDEGYTRTDLIIHTDDKKMTDKVMSFVCKRYGCELDVDREELVAKEDYILVQTMLAIYTWIEFKEGE